MNKTFILTILGAALLSCSGSKTFAQERKNLAKVNALALIGGETFAFEYERALTQRITAGAMFSVRGRKRLLVDASPYTENPDVREVLEGLALGATSFALEGRFYTGKKGMFRGFYWAPYFKYADYGLDAPISIAVNPTGKWEQRTIVARGNLKTSAFGLGVGVQFRLGERVSLDWRIMGIGIGSARGTLAGTYEGSLTPEEQQLFREEIDKLEREENVRLYAKIVSREVDANGLTFKTANPWASIRTGLSIGYKF